MNNASPARRSPALSFGAWTRAVGVVLLLVNSLVSSFAASSFTGLGVLPGRTASECSSVSDDGSVVVGSSYSDSGYGEAFCWTAKTGMVGLGFLPGGRGSGASSISSNGSVIVGSSESQSGWKAFLWTRARGMVDLGQLPGGSNSFAQAVSGDGSVIAGTCCLPVRDESQRIWYSPAVVFRWTAASGMIGIGYLPGPGGKFYNYIVHGISSDGSVIVGEARGNTGRVTGEALRWTAAGGMVGLGVLPGPQHYSQATAVSSDGSVVVGRSNSASGEQAFRWTAADGMTGLGFLGPTNALTRATLANAVSSDGSVVLGHSSYNGEAPGFIWDRDNGMRNFVSLMTKDYNMDLTGWRVMLLKGISSDGKTIIGNGYHNGRMEAWVARLDKPVYRPAAKGTSK